MGQEQIRPAQPHRGKMHEGHLPWSNVSKMNDQSPRQKDAPTMILPWQIGIKEYPQFTQIRGASEPLIGKDHMP